MRSTSSTAILEIIQNKLISHNCETALRLYVEKSGAWVLNHDIDWIKGIDWSESGKNQKYATPALTPLASEISFQVYNENGKYSTGSGTAFEDYFDNNVRVKLQAGYNVGDNLTETSESLNLNDIAGSIIYSYFFNTEYSGGNVIIDPDSGITPVHFADVFDPLYDSETYDDSTYTPDAYTVQTYDSTMPGFEQFNSFAVTANNTDGKIYYRTFDDTNEVDSSIFGQWTYAGVTVNGTQTIDLDPDIVNERFLQIAVLYDGIAWGEGQQISDITVYYQSNIEWVYTSVYYLDTPEFDDPPVPEMPMIYCSGRDAWKRAIDTDVNMADYSGASITPTNFIKAIADRCYIQYNATSIDTISGFTSINWGDGFEEPIKAIKAFEYIMQKISPTGYQMYMKYDSTIDDNILYVTQKPDTLVADGVFSYKNYLNVGNSRKNNDKTLSRFTVFTDQQTVQAEAEIDDNIIDGLGDFDFNWNPGTIYVRFVADDPTKIRGTVSMDTDGATLTITTHTGNTTVTAYGCEWNAAPTYEGEAINFNNMIDGIGSTYTSINPLMTSDAECKSMAEAMAGIFDTPVYEAQGLSWPYINLLPEINDVFMLWRRWVFRDNLYYITKVKHHWDRDVNPSESTSFDLDDSGRNFNETSDFIWDEDVDWDRGFVWDMGISTPQSTDAEIDAASIIIHNVDCS
jgi:hypothetical protein